MVIVYKDLFGGDDEVDTPENKPIEEKNKNKESEMISSILKKTSPVDRISHNSKATSVLNELEEKRKRTLKALKVKANDEKKGEENKVRVKGFKLKF